MPVPRQNLSFRNISPIVSAVKTRLNTKVIYDANETADREFWFKPPSIKASQALTSASINCCAVIGKASFRILFLNSFSICNLFPSCAQYQNKHFLLIFIP